MPLALLDGHFDVGELLLLAVEVGGELVEQGLLLLAVKFAILYMNY